MNVVMVSVPENVCSDSCLPLFTVCETCRINGMQTLRNLLSVDCPVSKVLTVARAISVDTGECEKGYAKR